MTAEQLQASRLERMRLNGHGALSLEDARTWIEETGLCLFLPKRQFSSSIVPSFVEAVVGESNATPEPKQIADAEHMLVRLENDGVAVRLNLLGVPGEQPDFVVAAWVLPYVYALRGDRDWRRSPQLTGSRQVSQLAVQTYKLLEAGESTVSELTRSLGREVTETAVIRAITELWQQLRIIPMIAAPGQPARWQPLRQRFQKAIAEGASTSQVTAISVLASIYLQAVIAASMEDVEVFLSPLTARSKVREVIRGLVATRQLHTMSLGHAPHFYVAGTLPEFSAPPALFTSASIAAFYPHMDQHEQEEELHIPSTPVAHTPHRPERLAAAEAPVHAPETASKPAAPRPRMSRPAAHSRDRKPAAAASNRPARRAGQESRGSSAGKARPATGTRWSSGSSSSTRSTHNSANAAHSTTSHSASSRSTASRSAASGGASSTRPAGKTASGSQSRTAPSTAWSSRNGHSTSGNAGNGHSSNGKPASKTAAVAHKNGHSRAASAVRNDARKDVRTSGSRKPVLTATAKAGNSKRYGLATPAKSKTKKRG